MKLLETKRCILRNFHEDDLEDFYEYAKVEGVGEMAGWTFHKSIDESKRILDMFINEKHTYAIVLKETGKVIGSISRKQPPKHLENLNCTDIGYTIAKGHWGKGIMPEVFNAFIKYIFANTEIEMITVEHFVTNNQSRRVIEKCGGVFFCDDEYYSESMNKKFKTKRYIIKK